MSNQSSNVDQTILKVRGESSFENKNDLKNYIKSLASAVMTVVEKHGHAKLKIVGASAMNNAAKAAIIAIRRC